MRRRTQSLLLAVFLVAAGIPAVASAQVGTDEGGGDIDETDTSEKEKNTKPWTLSGSIKTRVGQGTFVGLENETDTPGEYQSNSTAYDRANLIYTFSPSYRLGEFNFGAEFQLVQWLTPGGGTGGITPSGGANDPADAYFQDISLSAGWKGHTFKSIGLNLAPSLSLGIPTSKSSRLNSQITNIGAELALSKTFFEKLSMQGVVSATKYFHRYKTSVIDPDRVGEDNVLFRPGEAEDVGNGLVALGGRNISHVLSFGGATQVKIIEKLSGSISYFFVNYYSYPGNDGDEFSSEYAKPGRNLAQAVSTSVTLSYKPMNWMTVSGGVGSFMSPKTSDNKSFRFPFWNTDGAAANRSWLQLGVSAKY